MISNSEYLVGYKHGLEETIVTNHKKTAPTDDSIGASELALTFKSIARLKSYQALPKAESAY